MEEAKEWLDKCQQELQDAVHAKDQAAEDMAKAQQAFDEQSVSAIPTIMPMPVLQSFASITEQFEKLCKDNDEASVVLTSFGKFRKEAEAICSSVYKNNENRKAAEASEQPYDASMRGDLEEAELQDQQAKRIAELEKEVNDLKSQVGGG